MRFLSPKALAFRRDVKAAFLDANHPGFGDTNGLSLSILLNPPDKRKRDIDNPIKVLVDSLEHAGCFDNDYQINELYVYRSAEYLGNVVIELDVSQDD